MFILFIAKCIHELHWNSWYLNVTFLSQQDLHWVPWPVLICSEQCIEMMQMLPFRLKEPLKKLILHSGPWHDAEDPPLLQQLRCSHKVKSSNLEKCNDLQHISGVHIGVVPDGGRHCCCCIDTWYVVQLTCQIMCQVGLKPLEKDSTNSTSITRRQHHCWFWLFEEWWE